jgi:hypothetical protein
MKMLVRLTLSVYKKLSLLMFICVVPLWSPELISRPYQFYFMFLDWHFSHERNSWSPKREHHELLRLLFHRMLLQDDQPFRPGSTPARFPAFLDDLLNSARRHFRIPFNLFCAHMPADLTENIPDHPLVEPSYPGFNVQA